MIAAITAPFKRKLGIGVWVIGALVGAVAPISALAWGGQGHQVIAMLAERIAFIFRRCNVAEEHNC